MTDSESDSRDTIYVTNTERKQLVELIPDLVELYEDRKLEDVAESLQEMKSTFDAEIEDGFRKEYDLGAEQWDDLVLALEEVGSTRADWLKSKLARRSEQNLPRMAFKRVPFMPLYIGETPKRTS